MGSTTELRRALKAKFFPFALDRGFTPDERPQPNSTVFRRRVDDRVQMFEVQWEKYGRPRFALHFGSCPADGLLIDGKAFAPDETFPTWCPDAGSLQPNARSVASSFRQDATLIQRLLGRPALRAPADVVDELLAWFPEIERYWAGGEIGRHLRLWRLQG